MRLLQVFRSNRTQKEPAGGAVTWVLVLGKVVSRLIPRVWLGMMP